MNIIGNNYSECSEKVKKLFENSEIFRLYSFELSYENLIDNLVDISEGNYDEDTVKDTYFSYYSCNMDIEYILENHIFEKLDPSLIINHQNLEYGIQNFDDIELAFETNILRCHMHQFSNIQSYMDRDINFRRIVNQMNSNLSFCIVQDEIIDYYRISFDNDLDYYKAIMDHANILIQGIELNKVDNISLEQYQKKVDSQKFDDKLFQFINSHNINFYTK